MTERAPVDAFLRKVLLSLLGWSAFWWSLGSPELFLALLVFSVVIVARRDSAVGRPVDMIGWAECPAEELIP